VLRASGEQRLVAEADHHFGMPKSALTFEETLDGPLYVPARAASN
jgi:hypothetical protein